MENAEALSPATRAGIVLTGALQGLFCYFITWYIDYASLPADSPWLLCAVPATVMVSTTIILAVTSFRRPRLWLALLVILAIVAGMGVWLRWNVQGLERWDIRDEVLIFGFQLLLMSLLLLPWLQRWLFPSPETFYRDFHRNCWHNALALLVIVISNGLFWLVLFLWSELFKLVGIDVFETLFFETHLFIAVAIGVVSASSALLARTQGRLILALQNLLTLIATGLLPLVAALSLIFIAVLPFVGLDAISARISAAGLLVTLAILLLLLVTVVWHPQRDSLPYFSPLRAMIRLSMAVVPVYPLLAAWALWLRIGQYGWTPERLYGVLITAVTLLWAVGCCVSVINPRRDPLTVQRYVVPATGLLSLLFLVLINTPVIDPWSISVNSHMARYHDGKIEPDQVSLYMLSHTGRQGREALEALQGDATFIADPKRQRQLSALLSGTTTHADPLSVAILEQWVQLAPGMARPDASLWQAMMKYAYRFDTCTREKGICILAGQDLNGDGKPEAVVYQFGDRSILVFTQTTTSWTLAGEAWKIPDGLTRAGLMRALEEGKVKAAAKPWADISVSGERIELRYDALANPY